MKLKLYQFVLISFSILFLSCESNVVENIASTSPNGNYTVLVNGTQETWADPWQITIRGVHGGSSFNAGIGIAHMSTPVKGENLRFTWIQDNACEIEFESHDGEVQKFTATFP